MTLLMDGAMPIVMVVGMWSVFKNKKANITMLIGFPVLFWLARSQTSWIKK